MNNIHRLFLDILKLLLMIFMVVTVTSAWKSGFSPSKKIEIEVDANHIGNDKNQYTSQKFPENTHTNIVTGPTPQIECTQNPKNVIEADIDGDDQNETIRMFFKKVTLKDNPNMDFRQSYIQTEVNGVKYEECFGMLNQYRVNIFSFQIEKDKKKALIVDFDCGGTGHGLHLLYVLEFNNGFKFLKLPKGCGDLTGIENGSLGFIAKVAYIDDYKARIVCDETGFSEDIQLDKEFYKNYSEKENQDKNYYDNKGKLLHKIEFTELEGICEVKIVDDGGKQYLEIAQFAGSKAYHINGIGYLISTLTFENGMYKVVHQRCDPWK